MLKFEALESRDVPSGVTTSLSHQGLLTVKADSCEHISILENCHNQIVVQNGYCPVFVGNACDVKKIVVDTKGNDCVFLESSLDKCIPVKVNSKGYDNVILVANKGYDTLNVGKCDVVDILGGCNAVYVEQIGKGNNIYISDNSCQHIDVHGVGETIVFGDNYHGQD